MNRNPLDIPNNKEKPVLPTGLPATLEALSPDLPAHNVNNPAIEQQQKSSLSINHQIAKQFLSRLDCEASFFTFQTFDDNSKRKDRQLARVLHGTLDDHYHQLCSLQNKGAGVFVTINATNGLGRSAQHIQRIRALFVDLDGTPLGPILDASIEPHLIIESSPGRYHAYWFVTDCPMNRFSIIQKQLAERFNGDRSVYDLARVMRLPGFIHQKQTPCLSRIYQDLGVLPISFQEFEEKMQLCKNTAAGQEDEILKTLQDKGMVKKQDSFPGCYSITCPWARDHSTDDIGTKYYAPGHNGYLSPGFKCFHTHCKDKTIQDLKTHLGMSPTVQLQELWGDPIPLPEGLPPVASFDESLLPDAIRPWILDIAERMQIPPDFSAASAIVVASSLIGRRCGIYPKEKDNWLVVPNLWGAIIGRPALLKSPAISEVMKPLNYLVTKAIEEHQKTMQEFKKQLFVQEAQSHALKVNLQRAAKKNASQGDLEELVDRKQTSLEELSTPIERRYKTEDATTEKIGEILKHNPHGILVHRDELIGWLKSLDRYGRENDRAFFLESWNGTGSFTVDRISRGTLYIPALCLSILGGIQPGPLRSYVYQAISHGEGDDGLLQRFQMTVWPDPPTKWVNVDRWPDTQAKKRAYDVYERLSQINLPSPQGEEIPGIRFSAEGQEVFNDWRQSLETKVRSGEFSTALESHLAKYRSLMPSIALILYLIDTVDNQNPINAIPERYALGAGGWCAYLENHAYRLYSSAQHPSIESARELLKHLRNGDVDDGFSLRDVYRKQWSKLTTTEEARDAVQVLMDYGWLRLETTTTTKKQHHRLHPSIRRPT